MSDPETLAARAAVYDDMKERCAAIGLKMYEFGEFIGVSKTTIPKWRSVGTPPYALNILQMLETYGVPASWKVSRARPEPTNADALDAIRKAATAVIDDAIGKGWSRQQIAFALRALADETDPRRT
ncbi:helix-turn-helix domain-containing protein [Aureimonas phyllosphaerae]|uniref:Transcriptional regulator with XRE-family HTH domain n=1 Tax=Aureimonas phyllosphaerae TaxID=1166078 RepID=A0A7W6BXA9_9HYPH|nr:helix-turn-helix transcriptional regulator [Aureimonas phyllosphaerae]MBB3938105.1 transcriptional regulator with XRE-family HTH domain [Aureimonas phyllosphaerae]MBB3962112.1 transcriptional regulator with XRE-family HTH domain [Aureimonas phyllosphaerae]SFF55910.1 hypothetical protein SAMN05216566_12815 [Aureimonas phyllosphaerae]